MTTPNIVKVVTYVYGVDFSLGADWIALKDSLGLSSVEQTYLIWLWLDTAYDMTYSRVQDGGNDGQWKNDKRDGKGILTL